MATAPLHLPRLLFWLQFIAKERQTALPHISLFSVLLFFMSGGPADLEQSGNGGLWIPSDLLQLLNQHSWVTRERTRAYMSMSAYLDNPGGRVPVWEHMTQTYGFGNRPKGFNPEIHGDPRRSKNYSEFSSPGRGSLSSRVCWSTFKHIRQDQAPQGLSA